MIRPLSIALVVATAACGGTKPPPEKNPDASPKLRLDGRVRMNDTWLEVAPLVSHDAKMDLRTRCRVAQDEAKEQSLPVPPLCFEDKARTTAQLDTIRVERWPSLPAAIRTLTATAEGAHFLVERTGSFHQTLDLAFPVRRANEIRPTEVRVLAADPTHGKALVDALTTLFPNARIETVDGVPVELPNGPATPVIAPTKPPSPDDHGHVHGDDHGHDQGDDHGHDHGHDHDDHKHD